MEQQPTPTTNVQPRPTPERMAELKAAYKDGQVPPQVPEEGWDFTKAIRHQQDELAPKLADQSETRQEFAAGERDQRIEDRIIHGDGNELNEKAHLEIYGSGKHTYTKTVKRRGTDETYERVVASPKKPKKGILEEIKTNDAYGQGTKERNEKADQYLEDIRVLTEDEGLELSQAKLATDLRVEAWLGAETDHKAALKLEGKLIARGIDRDQARERAQAQIARGSKDKESAVNDDRRLEIIKDGGKDGVFTKKEYEEAKKEFIDKGGDITAPDPEVPETPDVPDVPDVPTPADNPPLHGYLATDKGNVRVGSVMVKQIFDTPEERNGGGLLGNLGRALEDYTKLQPKFDRSIALSKKDQTEIEDARQKYEEARLAVNEAIAKGLESKGYNADEITRELMAQDVGVLMMPQGDQLEPQEISGGESGLIRDLTRQEAERIAKESRFVGWWGRQTGKIGFLKKAGVMLGVGVASGAVLAPAVAVGAGIAGAAAAGLVGKRVATGLMRSKVSNKADAATHANVHTQRRHKEQVNRNYANLTEHNQGSNPGVVLMENVTSAHIEGARDVYKGNQKRVAASVGVGLVAGAVVGDLVNSALNSDTSADLHPHSDADHAHPNASSPAHPHEQVHNPVDPGKEVPAGTYAELNVAPGSGFEDSLQAQYGLTDEQAHAAYESMQGHLQGADGTYDAGPGNIGVSSPGEFQVPPEAQKDLFNYLGSINKTQ